MALRNLAGLLAALGILLASPAAQAERTTTDDLQARLDAQARAGGGVVTLEPGEQIAVHNGVVLPEGVALDLNGGEIVARLDQANAAGVRMLSRSALRNGTVSVFSGGSPAMQAGAHAPVLVGALYGENERRDRLSPFEAPHGWVIANMSLRSDKQLRGGGAVLGAPAIQVVGGAHDGLIEHITVLDSDRMAGGLFLDWGTVGPITSGDIRASRKAFDEGLGYTTHPHDIVIRDIALGRLASADVFGTGSVGVRLSGVHDVKISNVHAGLVTGAGFLHTAGDLGFEFARPADRHRALLGNRLENLSVETAGAYLVRTDSYADNIGRAAGAGYVPLMAPLIRTDLEVAGVEGRWSGRVEPGYGLRVDHQVGGRFADIRTSGFRLGINIDEQAYDLEILRPSARDSIRAAILVGHPRFPPARIEIRDPVSAGHGNGLVYVERSDAVRVTGANRFSLKLSAQARAASVE